MWKKSSSGPKNTGEAKVQDLYMLKGEFEVDLADGAAARTDPGRRTGPHDQDRSSQSYCEHEYESFLAVPK